MQCFATHAHASPTCACMQRACTWSKQVAQCQRLRALGQPMHQGHHVAHCSILGCPIYAGKRPEYVYEQLWWAMNGASEIAPWLENLKATRAAR